MKSDIHMCERWRTAHDRPIYTLSMECPACGGPTINSAPAPFSPADPYGAYRRALHRRVRE